MKRHIALIGMMGAGKTTVGALLAGELGWRFLDSDAQIEAVTNLTVRDIFRLQGEEAFRDAEAAALKASIAETESCVIGVAGGAVLREDSRELLKAECLTVWLKADVETLIERVGDGKSRPLITDDPRQKLTAIYEEREEIYSRLANSVINVDNHSPEEIAHTIRVMYEDVGKHA